MWDDAQREHRSAQSASEAVAARARTSNGAIGHSSVAGAIEEFIDAMFKLAEPALPQHFWTTVRHYAVRWERIERGAVQGWRVSTRIQNTESGEWLNPSPQHDLIIGTDGQVYKASVDQLPRGFRGAIAKRAFKPQPLVIDWQSSLKPHELMSHLRRGVADVMAMRP